MIKNIRLRIALILVIFFGSLWYLYPTIYLSRMSPEQKKRMSLSDPQELQNLEERSIKLGLDLQGGMHLVLELDNSKLKASAKEQEDAIDRALTIIRTRVDQFGVSEPLIQKAGSDRIIVELAGIVDTARARALVEQSAYLEFKLCKPQGEFHDLLAQVDQTIAENNLYLLPKEGAGAAAAQPEEKTATPENYNPLDLFKDQGKATVKDSAAEKPAEPDTSRPDTSAAKAGGSLDSLIQEKGAPAGGGKNPFSRLIFQEPPLASAPERRQSELLVPLNNVPLVKAYLDLPRVKELVSLAEVNSLIDFQRYKSAGEGDEPDTLEVLWADDDQNFSGPDGVEYKRVFLMKKRAEMTGEYLADANATLGSGYDPKVANRPLVLMRLTPAGADSFETITERLIQRDLAIVLDGTVKFAPRIMSRIPNGNAQIEGVPSIEKARDLAIVLRAGALPAPLTIAESRTVGPSLGADSIAKGKFSAYLGLILVVIFMIFYYRFGGLVADVALLFNVIIILAVLAGFNATLTLPGIAGLILTIGMAVDANVLIFERIREELRLGKTLRTAIDAGYDRAFSTILDSNLTTFITAVVLFQFGTGTIKGFAVTLSIGLAASMFTAIFVTRVIFHLWTSRKKVKSIAL